MIIDDDQNQNNQVAAPEAHQQRQLEDGDEDDSSDEDLTEGQIDHLMSSAHDSVSEIVFLHLKKKERQSVGLPSASRSVFRVAKNVGVPVKFSK